MIFLSLLLAHLFGDFILQPSTWVANKEKRKLKSPYLYYHVGIHVLLAAILLFNQSLWWTVAIIGVSHLVIDASKLIIQKNNNRKFWFFLDQALHLSVIAGIALYAGELDLNFLKSERTLAIAAGLTLLTVPTSIILRIVLSSWSPVTVEHSKIKTESLVHAGKYIGVLERLLVFVFILVNHWEGVGFMIAAKSVFRFSDLAEAKQRKLTEYVLIGTLLSFGIAIITAILVKNYL